MLTKLTNSRAFRLILSIMIVSAIISPSALAVVEPLADKEYYVGDFSDVLLPSTKSNISDYNGSLETQCKGAQFVVVTVDYLDGLYADEYAAAVFSSWGIGDPDERNGLLLLLSPEENVAWLQPGAGLSGILSQSTTDKWMNTFFDDYFDKKDYDGGVNYILGEVLLFYQNTYNAVLLDDGYTGNDNSGGYTTQQSSISPVTAIASEIMQVVLIIIIIAVVFGVTRPRRRRYYGGYRRGGIFPYFMMGRHWHHRHGPRVNPPHNRYDARPGNQSRPGQPPGGFGGFGGSSGSGRGGSPGGGFKPTGFGGGRGRGGGGFGSGGGSGRR